MNARVLHNRSVTASPRNAAWLVMPALVAAAEFVSAVPYSDIVLPMLASRFEQVTEHAVTTAVGLIVLGGDGDVRLLEAGRLARRFPHLLVIATGAGEADDVREVLGGGISDSRIQIEELAKNTRENARNTRALIDPEINRPWILVTSASHMPRAVGAFRRYGIDVHPWPVADGASDWRRRNWIVRHEVLGLIAYRLLGESSALFPSQS
jgi:uncharacterized SAM-binding protein YcdF (DUF218 family)